MHIVAKKRFSKRKMAETSILDLPFELAANILSRLPITAIVHTKSVCKLWKTYLSDPEFFRAKPYHHVSLILFQYNDPSFTVAQLKPKEAATTTKLILPHLDNIKLVGSCNELVCFKYRSTNSTYQLGVSNPMTREFQLLPPLPNGNQCGEVFVFGFSSKTGEYKVLRIFQLKRSTRAQVCTVNGSGGEGWRPVVPSPLYNDYQFLGGVTFNGASYWIADGDGDGADNDLKLGFPRRLASFDIDEEKIQYISCPDGINDVSRIGLGVLRGCLCMFQAREDLDIWSMKEQESWTKETIRIPLGLDWFQTYHSLVHLSDDQMVALHEHGRRSLFSFNRREDNITELLDTLQDFRFCRILPYVPSFLPLDYLLKGN